MSYTMFINNEEMPITPSKLQLKIKGQNKTVNLVNDGEVNFLRSPGLTDITVPLLLPMLTLQKSGKSPDYYLELFENTITQRKPCRLILSRASPDNSRLYDTNINVSIESYSVDEDATNGLDVAVSLTLKQYKAFGTKTVEIIKQDEIPLAAVIQKPRETSGAPKGPHTVVKGDCLYNISTRYYGNGAEFKKIYQANRSVIDPRNQKYKMPSYTIYPGQVLTIP